MFAKNFELLLMTLCENSDVAGNTPDDFVQRFESLRSYGKLPRGRGQRHKILSVKEITAAILGLVPTHPNWAGHGATILCELRAICGTDTFFFGNQTLSETISHILVDIVARKSVIRLEVSLSESGVNSHGHASLSYEINNFRYEVFYAPNRSSMPMRRISLEALEKETLFSPTSRAVVFNRSFFERVARELDRAKSRPGLPAGDGSEYDSEEALQERYNKLGVRSGSRFLNIGVYNQVTWPKEETLIKFDKYEFILMPKTRDHVQSIHFDLFYHSLSESEAMTVINRFLSIMTWCDDQFAVAQDGFSGNPVPVPVRKHDLGFITAYMWIFDRKIPPSGEARRALALYREARNAEQNHMISYAVLNYCKIIEIKYHGRGPVKNWFRDNLPVLMQAPEYKDEVTKFVTLCGNEKPHEYIYKSCRIAVAHAGKYSKSDPDDWNELNRLHTASEALRILARYFISEELKVSSIMYSGD